ncbi:hypothetical protein BUH_4440 [Burkholderia pseudomallei Pakistan 9]|nr:hypothetical protein BUH_4440 [Burkholderia pseudomallei Pakistan 9]
MFEKERSMGGAGARRYVRQRDCGERARVRDLILVSLSFIVCRD